jgi:hypothetical protein
MSANVLYNDKLEFGASYRLGDAVRVFWWMSKLLLILEWATMIIRFLI